ncbi:MAG: 30S ribosomal protein S17 [Planctomycetes bacterium]|nr:30S ribosomal protein S17 [Planctomycetota bacterium]
MIGVVLSAKGGKTIVVAVSRDFKHPKYEKRVRRTKHYAVHDEINQAKAGDQVEVMETRKLSKTKNWRLLRILKRVESAMP